MKDIINSINKYIIIALAIAAPIIILVLILASLL